MNNPSGNNWILLRGLTRESAHWGDFIGTLQAAFPEATVTPLDLPGTGRHYRSVSPKTIRGIADKVRAEAFEQGALQRPATILALSLGAMVAWEWMRTYPDDIGGAVLINCSFAGISPFYRRLRWQIYGRLAALTWKRGVLERESALLHLLSNRQEHYPQLARDWERIQKERPVSPQNTCCQILAAATYDPGEPKPGQPVLLLNSRGDRLVAPSCSEAISNQWHLTLDTHPWGGHDLTVDDGEWVVGRIKNWLNQPEPTDEK
ncbi:alpha/beta fold hydrolase [Methylosarcina fibrata]|uniref:alpha/beta fold hydrolase n=1 Tax=Methylosarcina fibrata TaxID=105972 RepID=UPI0003635C23|nr:alpha/beta hydrolase [Methylosarcina fibrata]